MTWYYQDTPVETLPDDYVGFVYCITNNLTGRKYIGKKLAKFSKTTYKTVKQKNGIKKRKKYEARLTVIGESTGQVLMNLKKTLRLLGRTVLQEKYYSIVKVKVNVPI